MPEIIEDTLIRLSAALGERVVASRRLVAAIRCGGRPLRSGTLWRQDAVVASEQALPDVAEAEVILDGGQTFAARVAGRDRGTNIAVLRLDGGPQPAPHAAATGPEPGALVLAIGADPAGGVAVRLGAVHSVGPAWHSRAGGQIDRRITLDLRLEQAEEGGPVVDAAGGLVGISTLGPRRRVLVIPAATVERVLDPLLTNGRVARGWLGAAVQPVLVPDELRTEAGQPLGLMVIGLTRGGPAAQAGIMMGDILIGVDGAGLGSPSELAGMLGPESVGRQVQLRLIRGGAVQALAVTVGARPVR
ncbi:MAG TPA: S1C family serine protease [Stellaceae bacterium]|nr:S1C family serine protease [Stellaceae bacterium]